ncbi:exonuclease domain-containing protein [Schaalia sp. Marseille-Q2122]|uniref:exonuclease domain-containing protein n=1 Tax=Schaalia sp. Marseille-Q2122 TaxID=2736604 RepID=UPI00158D291B|nr:exonuclease domain-containing protein [Schaalia sp. Marseille-Q2122]
MSLFDELPREQGAVQADPASSSLWSGSPAQRRRVSAPRSRRASQRRSRYIPSADQLMAREFVAVDFETANRQGGVSACQIALVKVRHGRVVDRFVSYLLPPEGFQRFEFTYLHGISFADVQRAPSWEGVGAVVGTFIGALPVYAHNAAFDARVWKDLDEYYQVSTFPQTFFCSYRLAARVMPGLVNHKLPTVARACVPEYHLNHHRADSDAEACALIVASLQRPEVAAQLF